MKRKGFTLIEILVVMAIIAALIAILFLSFGHVSRSGHANATHATLQTLRGMLTEYETSGGTVDKLESLYDPAQPHNPPDVPVAPPEFPAAFQMAAPPGSMQTLPANDARLVKTRLLMARLLAIPSNKKVLDSLPANVVDRSGVAPILLDARGNPIVYVPRQGMTGLKSAKDENGKYAREGITVTNPDRQHGFWLSAGEDGFFFTNDDNLSSFDQ